MNAHYPQKSGLFFYQLLINDKEITTLDVKGLDISVKPGEKPAYRNILIRRPLYAFTDDLYRWAESVSKIKTGKEIQIVLFDSKGKELLIWVVKNAIPVRYAAPQFVLEDFPFPLETMELQHSGWKMSIVNPPNMSRQVRPA